MYVTIPIENDQILKHFSSYIIKKNALSRFNQTNSSSKLLLNGPKLMSTKNLKVTHPNDQAKYIFGSSHTYKLQVCD